jgi:hypothetical protein
MKQRNGKEAQSNKIRHRPFFPFFPKLRLKEDFIYGEDEYFGNSQGRWVLERV